MKFSYFVIVMMVLFFSCSEKKSDTQSAASPPHSGPLFSKISDGESGITFKNVLEQRIDFNFMNYMYVYTGAGVAVGDIDNDGLEDLYFVSNLGPNKLYKNEGDFKFTDITTASKTNDNSGFSTGVTLLDINNDGWLDIYVCKAGSLKDTEARRNLLFVNQQNGSFVQEAAKWGLDDPGFSTQLYQIDFDNDGDLDVYLVNHRFDFQNNGTISSAIQRETNPLTSDQLYRNDGTTFTNVTEAAGLVNKAWGLSAVIADFNEDGWDDIYVANDFLEPDAMYINQQDGTFKNEILTRLDHISTNSMGSDYADLNNDLLPDLITVDMLSENYARSKENMASMSISGFNQMVDIGYHHAYMANTLQINKGRGKFMETGQISGVVKTDWSWAPLLADFDNDGLKDIFVTNGVDRDYTNQDARNALKDIMRRGESKQLQEVLDMIPTERISNYIYKNEGELRFSKKIKEWGLDDPGYSNGAIYADLDNDGDLDLVTNNLYDPAGVYRNNTTNSYSKISLVGPRNNPFAVGAKVWVKTNGAIQYQEVYPSRGFESSVSHKLIFGLGNATTISEVLVEWPDGKTSTEKNPKSNTNIVLRHDQATSNALVFEANNSLKKSVSPSSLGIDYKHLENPFNDYNLQLLLPQKQSSKGTGIVTADVNADGRDDFFVGNATNAPASLYMQQQDGTFAETNEALWQADAKYEDANALFFDADGDGDQDLYVVSAGYELSENSPLLQDRLYTNDGQGNFERNLNALPKMLTAGKAIAAADYDADGDLDLFVGGNVIPGKYPLPPSSYLLENNNGVFKDSTPQNKDLAAPGMVSEALFTDYDGDNDLDLMLVGEWMAPTVFDNHNGSFTKSTTTAFEKLEGWYFSAIEQDMDGDGDMDYFFGNIGNNNKFQPSREKPLYIYAKDFDSNGSYDIALSKINEGRIVPVRGKECSSEQNPFLLEKIQSYKEFANLDMEGIYGKESLKDAFKSTVHAFETIYAQNDGQGNFNIVKLPIMAQLGPTLSFVTNDFNNDGIKDVMGVGAIYDAEVETIRYDSNYGYVLLGDENGNFTYTEEFDPFLNTDVKDITKMNIKGTVHYVAVSNNAPLAVFTF